MRLGKCIAIFVMFLAAATFAAAQPHIATKPEASANARANVRANVSANANANANANVQAETKADAKTVVTAQNCRQGRFSKQLSDTLYIYFRVGKTNVVPSFMGNSRTLETFDRFLTDYTNTRFNFSLNGITLQGSASPEGKVHWNKILANRRADAIAKYIKNEHSVNQQLVQKDNVTLNTGAHYTKWPELRSTRIIVDYSRVSKEDPLPAVAKQPKAPITKETTGEIFTGYRPVEIYNPDNEEKHVTETTTQKERFQKKYNYIAVKTNALYDLLLTPNIGVELPINNKYSVAVNWMYAWWKRDQSSWYHRIYGGDIEIRRYIRQWPWKASRAVNGNGAATKGKATKGKATTGTTSSATPLTGWHIGAYAQMLTYDFEWGGTGYLGDKWSYAAGIAVGYSKNLAKRLNLDFTLGVGYLTGEYIEYKPIDNCYVWQATKDRHWVGPTKAEVSLVWLLGRW